MEMQALSLDKIKLKINKVQEFMLSDFKPPTHTHTHTTKRNKT